MICSIFQDKISEYLDGALVAREKAEFAAHRLSCRECREVFNDVRDTVQALSLYAHEDSTDSLVALEARIMDATSAGEMLSCTEFDKMIERYFDGVILGPTFQNFQAHFEGCWKCRRLLRGIEEAKDMMREAREEIEMPADLSKRIMAATIGQETDTFFDKLSRSLKVGQWVAAMLIFAATGMLINYRYGSVENLATQKQELFNQAVIDTGTMAVAGMQFLSVKLNDTKEQIKKRRESEQSAPSPTPSPVNQKPSTTDQQSR
ncbi:MAG: zf-HC2 domain-containing protein [Blastocatellia bacterium]|nr:zf-HC2 domain-containing protein [Blastocatellia bacterium]